MICVYNVPGVSVAVSGHAGYAEKGHDIVCAGISCLVDTLLVSLSTIAGIETNSKAIQLKDGYFSIERQIARTEVANALVEAFICGCRLVAEQYPEYCSVIDILG